MKVRISLDAEYDLADGFWFYEEQENGLGSRFRLSVNLTFAPWRFTEERTRFGTGLTG